MSVLVTKKINKEACPSTKKSEEKSTAAAEGRDSPVVIDNEEKQIKPRTMKELRSTGAIRAGRSGRTTAGKGKKQMITALLGATGAATSGANAAQNVSLAWDVTAATDWASFIAEWDECRVLSIDIWAAVVSNGAPTVNGMWAINFDPENAGAPSGLNDVIVSPVRLGPYLIANNQVTWPQMVSLGGMPMMKSGSLSKSTALGNGTTVNLVCGSWFPTSATNAVAGYAKLSVPALGAGVTSTCNVFGMYKCEFRMRT